MFHHQLWSLPWGLSNIITANRRPTPYLCPLFWNYCLCSANAAMTLLISFSFSFLFLILHPLFSQSIYPFLSLSSLRQCCAGLCWGRRYFNKSACFLFFFDPLSVCLLCYIKPASGMLSSPALSITAYNVSLCFDLCREKYCRGRPGAILTCFTFSLLTHRLNYEFTCHLLVWETCPKWQYHIYIKNLIWHE